MQIALTLNKQILKQYFQLSQLCNGRCSTDRAGREDWAGVINRNEISLAMLTNKCRERYIVEIRVMMSAL